MYNNYAKTCMEPYIHACILRLKTTTPEKRNIKHKAYVPDGTAGVQTRDENITPMCTVYNVFWSD